MRLRSACCVKSAHDISDFSDDVSDFCTFGCSMFWGMERTAKERMETLGEAAARLLQGMVQRTKQTGPLAETARPMLRLVAANEGPAAKRGGTLTLPAVTAGEELGGCEFDAMTSATGLDDDGA
jgi:hypothetical protein